MTLAAAMTPPPKRSRSVALPVAPAPLKVISGGLQSAACAPPSHAIHVQDYMAFLGTLPDKSVDLIITDPPYSGMNRKLNFGGGRIVGKYASAGAAGGKWYADLPDDPDLYRVFFEECHRVLRKNRHIYVMFDNESLLTLGPVFREVFALKSIIVWDKGHMGLGENYRRQHEIILFAKTQKGTRRLTSKALADVIYEKRIYNAAYPTQKPVALFDRFVRASVSSGFTVCDPFAGSGSTSIAALQAGCSFVGADISPRAVAIANWRSKHFLKTCQDPLEGPGRLRGVAKAIRTSLTWLPGSEEPSVHGQ